MKMKYDYIFIRSKSRSRLFVVFGVFFFFFRSQNDLSFSGEGVRGSSCNQNLEDLDLQFLPI